MSVKIKLLKHLPKFIHDSGYLHFDLTKKLYSMGGILEKTGQLLYAIQDMKESEQIIQGLASNEVIGGLVPRTRYYGLEEPKESKPNRWEELHNVWNRTDVSHSQFFYLAMGLWSCKKNNRAELLLKNMLIRLSNNDFCIKTIYGENADEGRFYPFGNAGLRMLALYQMGRKLNLSPKLKAFNKFLLKLNIQFMSQTTSSGSDCWNTYQALKTLANIDHSYSKYFKNFTINNISNLPRIDKDSINYNKNIEDAIVFLNCPLVRL